MFFDNRSSKGAFLGFEVSEMCTGNYFEHFSDARNNRLRPPAGTRCAEPCIYEKGRWGSSYCFTEDGNWGAECVSCPGEHYFSLLSIV